jgi:hypothetical protein
LPQHHIAKDGIYKEPSDGKYYKIIYNSFTKLPRKVSIWCHNCGAHSPVGNSWVHSNPDDPESTLTYCSGACKKGAHNP